MLATRSLAHKPGLERVSAMPSLDRALSDLSSPDARQLRRILGGGLAAMTQHPLRARAAELLASPHGTESLAPGSLHLLTRLSTAGLMPTYDEYIAVTPLAAHLTTEDPDLLLRGAADFRIGFRSEHLRKVVAGQQPVEHRVASGAQPRFRVEVVARDEPADTVGPPDPVIGPATLGEVPELVEPQAPP